MDFFLFVVPMICLLGFAACMNGCETAWFSLSVAEGDRLRTTEGWAARPVRHLLARPEQLLMTLLLGNLLVTLLFLSLAAELALDFERRGRGTAAVAVGTGALVVLIFFG